MFNRVLHFCYSGFGAVVYSKYTRDAKLHGDLAGARYNSFHAKRWFMATVLAGILTIGINIILRQFKICIGIPCFCTYHYERNCVHI